MARFTPHTEADVEELLDAIGVETLDDLFADVHPKFEEGLDLPPVLSEYESLKGVDELAKKNVTGAPIFLGVGAYDRIVPTAVGSVISRGEFLTSYTPYQPEISQGHLQAIFEFQSIISELTGLELSNASVYEGANAVAEAALMTARLTKRDPKVAVSAGLNSRYREVIETYGVELVELPFDGTTDYSEVPDDVSGVFVQSPNYFGIVEDIEAASEAAHEVGALCVAVCDPTSLSVLEAPGKLGADVAVGECQPLGMPLLYGGPYAGYMATHEANARQLPGRISGETVDEDGKLAYVLTLRAREQDIRRARANSNICTNQALNGSGRHRLYGAHGAGGTARSRQTFRLEGALSGGSDFRLQVSGSGIPTRRSCGSLPSRCRTWRRPARRFWRTTSSVGWTWGMERCSLL